jgi:hypothetical protein
MRIPSYFQPFKSFFVSRKLTCNSVTYVLQTIADDLPLQTQIDGLTGRVQFDANGRRSAFSLDLMELTKDGVEKVSQMACSLTVARHVKESSLNANKCRLDTLF